MSAPVSAPDLGAVDQWVPDGPSCPVWSMEGRVSVTSETHEPADPERKCTKEPQSRFLGEPRELDANFPSTICRLRASVRRMGESSLAPSQQDPGRKQIPADQ